MAIDTANKRASAINVSSPWRSSLPFPDGVIAQLDRQHTAFMYAGIASGAAAPVTAREHNIGFVANLLTLMNR